MTKRYRPSQFQKGDRDLNEPEITSVLKAAQENYRLLPTGFGADVLLISAPMAFIEVKNGAKSQLTEVERMLQEFCENEGIEYYVIRTEEDAADMLNRRVMLAEYRKVSLTPEREAG